MKGQKLLVPILVLFVAVSALAALSGCKPRSGGRTPVLPSVGSPAPEETAVPPTTGPGAVEGTPSPPPGAPPPVAPAPPEEVQVQEVRDLEYARYTLDGEAHPLLLDLYLPEPAPRPLPLLLYIHGGGWIEGSKAGCPGEPLARHGYAVACVDYRLARATPEGCALTFPAQIQDVKAAVRWLRRHADRYGLDPNRFAAIGDSSGGHLAALLGTSAGVPELAGPEGTDGSEAVQAVVDWYGPVDVTQGPVVFEDDACTTPWDTLVGTYGGEETPYFYWTLAWSTFLGGSLADPEVLERARMASPLTYVDAGDPPFLILHGEADDMVPIEQSERLAEALRRAGVEVTFIRLPNAGHHFGSPEEVLPEFLEPTLAFLDRHLRGAGGEAPGGPEEPPSSGVGGLLTHDTTWSGEVLVTETVVVPEGVTLTIEPGTVVKFRHYRGYKEGKVGLIVQGGTLKAVGTPTQQIWFTSDAEDPINGDWAGITLVETDGSRFDYAIVEYAEIGIEQFASQTEVSHSIIRWNNSEGLYAELSSARFEGNTIYGNAYHAIALENYNPEVRILGNLIIGAGHQSVHVEASQALIEGNEFRDFDVSEAAPEKVISLMAGARATVRGNRFEMHGGDDPFAVEPDSTLVAEDNDFGDGHVAPLRFDYRDVKRTELGYLPGSPEDRYLYVFDAEDETRRVVARYGEGLGLAWSLAYADGALWRFTAGDTFVRIDPERGVDYSHEYANPDRIAARGLAYDGETFWANDHIRRQIIRFRLGTGGGYPDVGSGNAIEIVAAFDYPEAVEGGGAGIATDGEYLYVPSALKPNTLLKLNKQGELVGEILFEGPFGPAITWDGTHFWTAGGNVIQEWTAEGRRVGAIYAPAVETWDLAWGDGYLWTINRTCEEWDDAKVFQIEVLNPRASLGPFTPFTQ